MTKYITTDDILGKEVIASNGEIIGVVQKLHVEATTKTITGITIDEGFMKPDLFIGLEFIKQFGIDSIFLSIVPKQKFIGLHVYDNRGKSIGIVVEIETARNSAKIKKMIVKQGFAKKEISAKDIKKIGSSVLLK